VIKANKRGERGLAMEPFRVYGEPLLALCVDERLTRSRKINTRHEPLPLWSILCKSAARRLVRMAYRCNTWMRLSSTGQGRPPPHLDAVP